jgi:hypothetical protein
MRAGLIDRAEFIAKTALKILGNSVLQLFGLVVDFVPLHAENLGEHALDQVMAVKQTSCNRTTFAGETDFTFGGNANQVISFQALDCHRHGGRRDIQPSRQRSRNNGFTFRFRFGNRLEIVLFRDGDLHQ